MAKRRKADGSLGGGGPRKDNYSQQNVNSWRPNWRDGDAYPFAEAGHNQFAWEFLRRNSEYQRLYDEIIEPFFDESRIFDIDAANKYIRKTNYKKLFSSADTNVSPIQKIFRKKFGIEFKLSLPSHYRVNQVSPLFYLSHEAGELIERPMRYKNNKTYLVKVALEENQICCIFDASAPIHPQVQDVENYLKRLQKKLFVYAGRTHMARYPKYLRVLDAFYEDVPIDEITAHINPDKTNFYPDFLGNRATKKMLKAGQHMQSGGYKYLISNNKNT